jgi:hypothetical protein
VAEISWKIKTDYPQLSFIFVPKQEEAVVQGYHL